MPTDHTTDADTLRQAAAALAQERAATSPPWPIASECYYPAAGLVAQGHTCPQCDGSHDHDWVGWHQGEHPFEGWSVTGQTGGPGVPRPLPSLRRSEVRPPGMPAPTTPRRTP